MRTCTRIASCTLFWDCSGWFRGWGGGFGVWEEGCRLSDGGGFPQAESTSAAGVTGFTGIVVKIVCGTVAVSEGNALGTGVFGGIAFAPAL